MTADEIFAEWAKDKVIDRFDPGPSLLDIADKRDKYLRILHAERAELRSLETSLLKLTQLKNEYYRGELNGTDELKELGWEPWKKMILKEDMARKVATDRAVIRLTEMVGEAKEKISIVVGILDTIKSLSFDIRAFMEWEKYKAGA